MTSNRTPLKLRDLPRHQALHEVACWLDDCDTHLATKRDGGLPTPWFNLAEGFSIVEAVSREEILGASLVVSVILTKPQRLLLEWLSKEDWSAYGECRGADLNFLIQQQLATVDGDEPHGRSGVQLTPRGRALAALGDKGGA